MTRRLALLTHETFLSLGTRNFRLFFFGQLVSQIGNWMTLIAQTLLVLRLEGTGISVGVLTACQFAPVLLVGAWAGLVADRSDKRKLLIIVQCLAMAQSFVLAGLAAMDRPPLVALYLVAIAGGLTIAFDNPARRAFVTEMVPPDRIANAVSLNSAVMTGARVVGPALAGLAISEVGFAWAFALDGISYVAVIAGYLLMRPGELQRVPPAQRGRGQVREGLRYVRSVPELWIPLVMMTIVGTLSFNFQVVMPLFVTRTFGGSDRDFTTLFAVLSVGSLAGALINARRRMLEVRDMIVSTALFGVALAAFAAAPSLALAYPIGIGLGLASITFLTSNTALVQMKATSEMRGRVLALQAIVFLGTTPIGGPILGAVCDAWGPRAGFLVGAVAALGAAALGVVAMRRVDAAAPVREPGEPDDAGSAGYAAAS